MQSSRVIFDGSLHLKNLPYSEKKYLLDYQIKEYKLLASIQYLKELDADDSEHKL